MKLIRKKQLKVHTRIVSLVSSRLESDMISENQLPFFKTKKTTFLLFEEAKKNKNLIN